MKHFSTACPEDFDTHSDATFWEAVDLVAARKLVENKSTFAVTQQLHGIRYEDCGLVWDTALRPHYRPISSLSWDWMHVFVAASGTMQFHANEFVHDVAEEGIPFSSLDDHLAVFLEQNKTCLRPLSRDFFSSRVASPRSKHGHLKAFAGEMLTVFIFFMYFCDNVLRPAKRLPLQCQGVELAFRIIDFLRGGQRNKHRTDELSRFVRSYRDVLLALYDPSILKVKAHLMFHIPCSIVRTGYVLSTFSNERRHRLMIGTTSHFKNAGNANSPATKFILCRLLIDLEHRITNISISKYCLTSKQRDCTLNLAGYFSSHRRPVTIMWALKGSFDAVPVRIGNVVSMSDGSGAEAVGKIELLCAITFADTHSAEMYALVHFMQSGDGSMFTMSGIVDFVHAKYISSVMCVVERTGGIQIVCRA